MAQLKVNEKWWKSLKEFERAYVLNRQQIDGLQLVKTKISAARKQFPDYVGIAHKGFITLPDGTQRLWTGSDSKKYIKI